jgi:ubiquinone/menaquinone biosynthesis C-methylase UbiE
MADFDATAARYDQPRALPAGVPEAIRQTLWAMIDPSARSRLLEIGAGTGRVGAAFSSAGDAYVGVDPSRPMLERFSARAGDRGGSRPSLAQADGQSLPFATGAFDGVLLVQVLSGVPDWRRVLAEARRVLRPAGVVALGQTVRPAEGLDNKMRGQLRSILAELGNETHPPGAGRDEARAWLASSASRAIPRVAARWEVFRTPRDFLARKESGARFSGLPSTVRQEALDRLADWAAVTFGGLDTPSAEFHQFEIDAFVFAE